MKQPVKGYYQNKLTLKYQVRFMVKGQIIHVGAYDNPDVAHNAFLKAKAYYTELSKTSDGRL
jgi:hypothetical protein